LQKNLSNAITKQSKTEEKYRKLKHAHQKEKEEVRESTQLPVTSWSNGIEIVASTSDSSEKKVKLPTRNSSLPFTVVGTLFHIIRNQKKGTKKVHHHKEKKSKKKQSKKRESKKLHKETKLDPPS